MATVLDAAEYILQQKGTLDTFRLQKLVYYTQVWSVVWDGMPLFSEPIEAWADGPVVNRLFQAHKANYEVDSVGGDASALTREQRDTVDEVIRFYGRVGGGTLSALTHREPPWANARVGHAERARGRHHISLDALAQYYGRVPTTGKRLPEEYFRGFQILLRMSPHELEEAFIDAHRTADEEIAWLEGQG